MSGNASTAATAFPLQESALFVLGALAVLPLGIAVVIVAALLRVPVNPLAIPRPRYPLTLPASKRTILLLTYGTRGDVQPMVALAVALRQLDFDPVVCTVDASRELCERNGVRFESCGLARTEQPAMLFDTGTDSFDKAIVVLAPVYGPMAHAMCSCWSAFTDLAMRKRRARWASRKELARLSCTVRVSY